MAAGSPEKQGLLSSIDEDGGPMPQQERLPPRRVPGPHRTVWWLWVLMFVQGVATLLPWNAFLTVTQYFANRLENSPFSDNFLNYYSFSFQIADIAFLLLETRYKQRISVHRRIIVPLLIQLVVFSTVLAVTKVSLEGKPFFFLHLALVMISGAATAWLQGGLFGVAAVVPPTYMHAMMSGQALGGLLIALLNVVTLGASGGSANANGAAFMFFLISVLILLISLWGYLVMRNHPIVVSHMQGAAEHRQQLLEASVNRGKRDRRRSYLVADDPIQTIYSQIKWPAIWVFLVFAMTLTIFPALAGSVVSTSDSKAWRDTYFVPVYVYVLFNLGDFVGRSMAQHISWPTVAEMRQLGVAVYLRFLLVPLFLFCNQDVSDSHKTLTPAWFANDAFPIIFMCILGVSNGLLGTKCMTIGPKLVGEGDQEAAGSMMVLFLCLGLLLGTLLSFAIKGIVCACNPFS